MAAALLLREVRCTLPCAASIASSSCRCNSKRRSGLRSLCGELLAVLRHGNTSKMSDSSRSCEPRPSCDTRRTSSALSSERVEGSRNFWSEFQHYHSSRSRPLVVVGTPKQRQTAYRCTGPGWSRPPSSHTYYSSFDLRSSSARPETADQYERATRSVASASSSVPLVLPAISSSSRRSATSRRAPSASRQSVNVVEESHSSFPLRPVRARIPDSMMSSQTRSHHNTTHRTGDRSYGDHGDEATSTSSVHYRLACERLDKIFARIPPLQGLTLRTGEPQVPVLSSSEPDRANSPPGAGDHARNNVNVTDGVVALPASNWVSTSQGLRVPQAATPFNRREPQVQGPIPYDIEYTMLRSELEIQKEQIRDEEAKRIPLDRSIQDLEETIRRQIEMLEANIRPGGEWKIRFDAQVKHNDSLEEEIARLEDQIAASDKKIKEATCIKPDLYPELTDADVRKRSRQGEKEKTDLQRRVKDYEWRLDNESKAFHTANEEKQKMILQVAELSKSIKKIGLEEADKAAVALSHHRVESEASAALGATVSGGAAKARKAAANPGRVDKSKTYPPPQSKPTKPSGGGGRLPK